MKASLLIPFLVAFTSIADDTNSLTSKVREIDRNKDGKADVRTETFYRGKARVMMVMSWRNSSDQMAVVTRSYLVNDKLQITESDDDGDGSLETLILHAPERSGIEVFKRHPDGTTRPVSTAALAIYKKMYDLDTDVGQLMRDYLDGKTDSEGVANGAKSVRDEVTRLKRELQELDKDYKE